MNDPAPNPAAPNPAAQESPSAFQAADSSPYAKYHQQIMDSVDQTATSRKGLEMYLQLNCALLARQNLWVHDAWEKRRVGLTPEECFAVDYQGTEASYKLSKALAMQFENVRRLENDRARNVKDIPDPNFGRTSAGGEHAVPPARRPK